MSSEAVTLKQLTRRRNLYLVFATLTLMVLGLIYAWSIFAAPIGRTYESYGPMLSQVFQVSMFAFCLSPLVGSQIVKRISAKAAIVIAAVLMATGFTLTALFAGAGFWALIVFYGILAGCGVGIAYNAIISLINPWFPDKTGFCSGVLMMGFGISSLVFGSLANALFGVFDWPLVFIGIAAMAFVIMFILAFVVAPAPKDMAEKMGLSNTAALAIDTPTQKDPILKTKSFWLFWVWSTLIVVCGLTLIGTTAQGAERLHLDESLFVGFGALLVGLVSTMNGISRIINGIIFDKAGLVPVMVIAAAVAVVSMSGLALSFAFDLGGLYIVAAILIAFSYGSAPVMGSGIARQRFGAQSFAVNLGIINCNIAIAATINLIIGALLGSVVGSNGVLIYGINVVFAAISLVVIIWFARAYKKDLDKIAQERQ